MENSALGGIEVSYKRLSARVPEVRERNFCFTASPIINLLLRSLAYIYYQSDMRRGNAPPVLW